MSSPGDIKDRSLADQGRLRIEWAAQSMPVVHQIRQRFEREKPFKGVRVAACLHVTTETAFLMQALKAGGAEPVLCASNPLSTQDDAAASLVVDHGIPVFAIKGEDNPTYYQHIEAVLGFRPMFTMDDGADLVSTLHQKRKSQLPEVLGGTEETTTGVIRLRSMERDGILGYPIIAVNEAMTKHLFDNRYGTGQSTIDGIIRATNRLLAGLNFVVSGYGWCGKGLAMRARGMGSHVIVTEVDPLRALEATLDGLEVLPMSRAAEIGDIFCTVTGNKSVLKREHFEKMKSGVILSNSGHFNVEIDIPTLEAMAKSQRKIREFVVEYTMSDGRKINLLGEGRLINLTAAEGHPSSVMDLSFSNQALSLEHLTRHAKELEKKVYAVPERIDRMIAELKLTSLGVTLDRLTPEQEKYLSSWEEGT